MSRDSLAKVRADMEEMIAASAKSVISAIKEELQGATSATPPAETEKEQEARLMQEYIAKRKAEESGTVVDASSTKTSPPAANGHSQGAKEDWDKFKQSRKLYIGDMSFEDDKTGKTKHYWGWKFLKKDPDTGKPLTKKLKKGPNKGDIVPDTYGAGFNDGLVVTVVEEFGMENFVAAWMRRYEIIKAMQPANVETKADEKARLSKEGKETLEMFGYMVTASK